MNCSRSSVSSMKRARCAAVKSTVSTAPAAGAEAKLIVAGRIETP